MKRLFYASVLIGAFTLLNALFPTPGHSQIGYTVKGTEVTGGPILLDAGSADAPAYAFSGDTGTGIFAANLNQLQLSAAGVERFRIVLYQLRSQNRGSLSIPSYSWGDDTNTGVYITTAAAAGVVDLFGLTQGGNDLGAWGVAEGEISNADLKTLNGTPVEVIAAPGAGFAVVIDSAQFMLDFATAGFDGVAADEDIVLEYTGGLDLLTCDNSTCIDAAAVADAYGYSAHITPTTGLVPVAAAAIDITILGGEWFAAAGGSTLRYSIRYRVIKVDFSS